MDKKCNARGIGIVQVYLRMIFFQIKDIQHEN